MKTFLATSHSALSRRAILFAALVFATIHFSPFCVLPLPNPHTIHSSLASWLLWENAAWFTAFGLAFVEGGLWFVLAYAVRFVKNRWLRFLARVGYVFSFVLSHVFLVVSWAVYQRSSAFAEYSQLLMFAKSLTWLEAHARFLEKTIAGCGLILLCAVATGILVIANQGSRDPLRLRRGVAGCVILGGIIGGFFALMPLLHATEPERNAWKVFFDSRLSPRLTMLRSMAPHFRRRPYPLKLMALNDTDQSSPSGISIPHSALIIAIEALREDMMCERWIDSRPVMPLLCGLRAHGATFPETWAASNESVYSKSAILSGTYPLKSLSRDYFNSPSRYKTVYDLLPGRQIELGYFTGGNDSDWRNAYGLFTNVSFSRFFQAEAPGSTSHANDDRAIAAFFEWFHAIENRRYFASLWLYGSHFPFSPGELSFDLSSHVPESSIVLPSFVSFFRYSLRDVPVMRLRYQATLRVLDAKFERIWETLQQSPTFPSTIVVITGDHGVGFGEHGVFNHGQELFEETLRVPLIILNHPKLPPGPKHVRASHVDIAPTILSALLPSPSSQWRGRMQGRDLSSIEQTVTGSMNERPLFATVQGFAYHDAMIHYPWKFSSTANGAREWLFNLQEDPLETVNLVTREPCVLHELRDLYQKYRDAQLEYFSSSVLQESYAVPEYSHVSKIAACRSSSRLAKVGMEEESEFFSETALQ